MVGLKVASPRKDFHAAVSDLNSHVCGNLDPNVFSDPSVVEAIVWDVSVT